MSNKFEFKSKDGVVQNYQWMTFADYQFYKNWRTAREVELKEWMTASDDERRQILKDKYNEIMKKDE